MKTPQAPNYLLPLAKAEWKRHAPDFSKRPEMNEIKWNLLAMYCQAYARWAAAEQKMKDPDDMVTETRGGVFRQSPWAKISEESLRQMLRTAGHLGLIAVGNNRKSAPDLPGQSEDEDDETSYFDD